MIALNYGPRLQRWAFRPLALDSKINILEGSVRSGKTWALHSKILQACVYPVKGWRFITGQSKDTIYTNVLNDLFQIVGARYYNYNHQSGMLRLFGSRWKVMGAKDEGSERFVRGSTIGIAICDEIVLMPEQFFKMLLTRMSPPGSRLYGSTNPDNPVHYLKTEYLDDSTLRKTGRLSSMHCTMDDNPNLTPSYIADQKAFYKGLFYERYILGRWVMAEGSIYRDAWSEDLLYDDDPIGLKGQGGHQDTWISVDCGVDHPQVYYRFYDDGKTIWCTDEYCWDSRKEMQQKTDAQYADDLIAFMGPNNACQIRVPPEAASFRAELLLRGLWVVDAENEVYEGIQSVSGALASKIVRINRRCKALIRTMPIYTWDPKKAKRGIEEPLKVDDDPPDAFRYGIHKKVPRWRYSATG